MVPCMYPYYCGVSLATAVQKVTNRNGVDGVTDYFWQRLNDEVHPWGTKGVTDNGRARHTAVNSGQQDPLEKG